MINEFKNARYISKVARILREDLHIDADSLARLNSPNISHLCCELRADDFSIQNAVVVVLCSIMEHIEISPSIIEYTPTVDSWADYIRAQQLAGKVDRQLLPLFDEVHATVSVMLGNRCGNLDAARILSLPSRIEYYAKALARVGH